MLPLKLTQQLIPLHDWMSFLKRLLNLGVAPLAGQHRCDVVTQEIMEGLPVLRIVKLVPNSDDFLSLVIQRDWRPDMTELSYPLGVLARLFMQLLKEFYPCL